MATVANRNNRWPMALATVLGIYVAFAGFLVLSVPVKDGARDWFASRSGCRTRSLRST